MAGPETARGPSETRRSRLTPEREQEIYGTVVDLLNEVDYDALTMDGVATRARASKATFYRQWKSKARLVAAAVRHYKHYDLESVDTGTLRGDLQEIARLVGDTTSRKNTPPLRALSRAIQNNAELADAVRESKTKPEMELLQRVVERALERGEIAPGNPALDFVGPLITGAALARPSFDGVDADAAYLARYMDACVLPALLQR
ncbi:MULTISPECIES: TetR/AcrR family transcriptional regulator [Streptomyces]|uniref:TetR/AcrR family transcriptional regulator n=1 Tax=Streptomyces lycopersici TaxID=2974589 RepID=UPI0021D21233|nr:TetR/AcrR family transcriptional regulator [Streptomyces sp. NEAU-383]